MGRRGQEKLTPKQEHALERVRKSDDDHRLARKTIERNVRIEVEKQLAAYEHNLEEAVYLAHLDDVPKTRIARDGLGTTSTNRVYEIIHEWQARAELELPELPEVPRFSWHAPERKNGAWLAWVRDDEAFANPAHDGTGAVPWAGEGWAFALFDNNKSGGWKLYPGQEDPSTELLEFARDNPLDPKEA